MYRFQLSAHTTPGESIKLVGSSCGDKPFRVLVIVDRPGEEFHGIPHVVHYGTYFDPDRMYQDAGSWNGCAEEMRHILSTVGVHSYNLFWCPPRLVPDDPVEWGNPADAKWAALHREAKPEVMAPDET